MPTPRPHVIVVGPVDRPTGRLLESLRQRRVVTRFEPMGHTDGRGLGGVTVFIRGGADDGRFRERPLIVCENAGRSHVERGPRHPERAASRIASLVVWTAAGLPDPFSRPRGRQS